MESWMIPAIVALPLLCPAQRMIRFIGWVALVLLWFVVFLTAARGTTVGVLSAIACGLVFLPQIRRRILISQAVAITLGLLLYVFLVFPPWGADQIEPVEAGRGKDLGSAYQEQLGRPVNNSSGRLDRLWPAAVRDIRSHPWLGLGPMNYACADFRGFGHPHNFVLQIAAEWGLIVAVILCGSMAYLLLSALWRLRKSGDAITAYFLLGVIAASVHALFSGVLVMPASQVTGLLVCGILLGRINPTSNQQPSRSQLIALFLAAELMLALLVFGWFELKTMDARADKVPPSQALHPRMWQDSRVCSLYLASPDVSK